MLGHVAGPNSVPVYIRPWMIGIIETAHARSSMKMYVLVISTQ